MVHTKHLINNVALPSSSAQTAPVILLFVVLLTLLFLSPFPIPFEVCLS